MDNEKEFIDERHPVQQEYYMIMDSTSSDQEKKGKLRKLIKKDPNYFDPYIELYTILAQEEKIEEAEKLLEEAYQKAIETITDEEGHWPEKLIWGFLENRHIIRTILNYAITLWVYEENDKALDIFRKLLKSNLNDNIGARHFILAIREGMSYFEYEDKFNKGGFYDNELMDWFDDNYKKYHDEFLEWEKHMDEYL